MLFLLTFLWLCIFDPDRLRALHAVMQLKVAETYEPLQLRHAKNVLLDILDDPERHQMHARRYAQCLE